MATHGDLKDLLRDMEQRATGESVPVEQGVEGSELTGGRSAGSPTDTFDLDLRRDIEKMLCRGEAGSAEEEFAASVISENHEPADGVGVQTEFKIQITSLASLVSTAQRKARQLGFFLVILRSDMAKNTVVLCCDRFGTYTSAAMRRKTATKKSGCSFTLSGRMDSFGQWAIVKQTGGHNHELHPTGDNGEVTRQLTQEQKQQRLALQRAGVRPKDQLLFLRQEHPNLSVVVRTMYNESQVDRRRYLNGRTPFQALFDELLAKEFVLEFQRGADGTITHLMFAHRQSADLARVCHKVLLLDCTYKTNRYKMPLLICGGEAPTNNTFFCCGIFLNKEEQSDYAWALGTIKKVLGGIDNSLVLVSDNEKALLSAEEIVFPMAKRVLCRWYINKNVLKKCKKYFSSEDDWDEMMARWNSLCLSPTEEEYGSRWSEFVEQYSRTPQLIEYVQRTWLGQRELFVECWVSKFLHLGCTSTSRVEGLRSFLKRFLSSSVGDLLTVTQELTLTIEHQLLELLKICADDRVKREFAVRSDLYNDVVFKVSRYALSMVQKRVSKDTPTSTCTSTFSTKMGLPCAHVFKARLQQHGRLNRADFDSQWWLDQPMAAPADSRALIDIGDLDRAFADMRSSFEASPPHRKLEIVEQLQDIADHGPSFRFRDPSMARPKGRPVGALNKRPHSTRREPSGFEFMEGSSTLRRKCGTCGVFGHNSRTCPNKTFSKQ